MRTRLKSHFVQRVASSRLIEPSQLAQARAAVGDDENALGQYLLGQGLLTRFQLRQLRAGARHFHVDKYIVVDFLGRGGNSLVLKARHTLLPGRFVALKTLDIRSVHRSDDALARFRREIEILGRMEHPNIVRALDVIRTRTQLYLVLEYVEGRDLASLVKERGPIPVAGAVGYTVQAARGLAYAHAHGVVHRDLKPGNLLVTRDGVVKIADLGLARFYDNELATELTLKGCCLGTPEYMAPEQAEDASAADARSDIFSLGATLFHLLTGELPLGGSSRYHRLQRLLVTPPRSLAESRPDLSAELTTIVDRMRARASCDRPRTAEEVITLLEPFTQATKPAASPRWDGRRRAALVLSIFRGDVDLSEAAARHGISVAKLQRWQQCFLEGAEQALEHETPENRPFSEHFRDLHAKLGEQTLEIEALRKRVASCNGNHQEDAALIDS
jgi:serine/threonine protein kinase